jgi:hypothetical protein
MQSKNKAQKNVLYVYKSLSSIKFPAFLLTIHGVYVFVYTIYFIANKLLS